MTAFGIAILQVCSCFGFGACALTALGIQKELPYWEQWTWSFAVGFGLLGWLLFFFGVIGWFSTVPLILVLGLGSCGVLLLKPLTQAPHTNTSAVKLNSWCCLLLTAIVIVAAIDLFEGLSPPIDGDSLAYHFVHPKNFLTLGRIEFIPRAGDGAIRIPSWEDGNYHQCDEGGGCGSEA